LKEILMRAKLLPLVLLALSPGVLPAQTADPDLAPVLTVFREEVKPGRMAAHGRMGASFNAIFAKANPDVHYLGLTSITGNNVVLYLEGHPSFAAAEQNVVSHRDPLELERAIALGGGNRGKIGGAAADVDDQKHVPRPNLPAPLPHCHCHHGFTDQSTAEKQLMRPTPYVMSGPPAPRSTDATCR
jgi:hypothetical protein